MEFEKAIGVACSTFAITNIDDLFVLVTFFAEASTSTAMTPLKIVLGQYIGFSVIITISMIGFAVAFVVPSEPIGFLGLLPIILGAWHGINLVFSTEEQDEDEEQGDSKRIAGLKSVFKVASVTVMNGGDNIGTYIPLFSQAKRAEIAVYVVVYYILLGLWCLVAYLIMNQKQLLRVTQKYVEYVLPLLYVGLGIFIVVKSECYPWSIEQIDDNVSTHPGRVILSVVTVVVLLACIGAMFWVKMRKGKGQSGPEEDVAGASRSYTPSTVDHVGDGNAKA